MGWAIVAVSRFQTSSPKSPTPNPMQMFSGVLVCVVMIVGGKMVFWFQVGVQGSGFRIWGLGIGYVNVCFVRIAKM